MDWAKTTARQDKEHLSFWICWTYIRGLTLCLTVPTLQHGSCAISHHIPMFALESEHWFLLLLFNTACLHQAKPRWTMQGQWFPVWCVWRVSQINPTHHLYSGYITHKDCDPSMYCFQQAQGGTLVKRYCITSKGIVIVKIKPSHYWIIFTMGIPITRKMVFILKCHPVVS